MSFYDAPCLSTPEGPPVNFFVSMISTGISSIAKTTFQTPLFVYPSPEEPAVPKFIPALRPWSLK